MWQGLGELFSFIKACEWPVMVFRPKEQCQYFQVTIILFVSLTPMPTSFLKQDLCPASQKASIYLYNCQGPRTLNLYTWLYGLMRKNWERAEKKHSCFTPIKMDMMKWFIHWCPKSKEGEFYIVVRTDMMLKVSLVFEWKTRVSASLLLILWRTVALQWLVFTDENPLFLTIVCWFKVLKISAYYSFFFTNPVFIKQQFHEIRSTQYLKKSFPLEPIFLQ